MRSVLKSALRYIAILPPFARFSMRMRERYLAHQPSTDNPANDENGLPVPDALLMMTVVGHTDWPHFLKSGKIAVETFADIVNRHGGDFANAERILDFGCGCGRLARHIPDHSGARLIGVDYNQKLVDWCATNLEGEYIGNELSPPANLPDAHIDILYALSVFTHLREDTQKAWLAEFARMLLPGGFAVVTFHDASHNHLERSGVSTDDLERAGIVYHNNRAEGSNLLSTFQTAAHFEALAGDHFELCEIITSANSPVRQAIALLRKPLAA